MFFLLGQVKMSVVKKTCWMNYSDNLIGQLTATDLPIHLLVWFSASCLGSISLNLVQPDNFIYIPDLNRN